VSWAPHLAPAAVGAGKCHGVCPDHSVSGPTTTCICHTQDFTLPSVHQPGRLGLCGGGCQVSVWTRQRYHMPQVPSSIQTFSEAHPDTMALDPMRFHLSSVRVVIIKKISNNKCYWGPGEKRTLTHCCWEHNIVQPLWKSVWRCLKKLKMKVPYDAAVQLLGI
jgi:hypothetical protein